MLGIKNGHQPQLDNTKSTPPVVLSRHCRAATRFFRKLLKGQEHQPGRLVTDKLSSYTAAHRAVMPSVAHRTDRYANNRAEVSHQPTR